MNPTPDTLPTPLAARITPKPTAKQIRQATAIALAEEYADETARLRQEKDELAARLNVAIAGYAQEHLGHLEAGFGHYGSYVLMTVTVPLKEAGQLELGRRVRDAEQALERRRLKTATDFLGELNKAAKAYQTPAEERLLDDPEIKAALLSAGHTALGRPTAADKANAIES
jgi:hypothetical protein